jgi:hypothetical protein
MEVLVAFFGIAFIVLFVWAWMNPGVLSAGWIVVGFLTAGCVCWLVSTAIYMWIAKHHPEKKSEIKPTSDKVETAQNNSTACQYEWPVISNEDVFLRIETQS